MVPAAIHKLRSDGARTMRVPCKTPATPAITAKLACDTAA
ncbi:unnamed protein product, partial [Rotaria magnacalcarata]